MESLEQKSSKLEGMISVLEDYLQDLGYVKESLNCLENLRFSLANVGYKIQSKQFEYWQEQKKIQEAKRKKLQEKEEKRKIRLKRWKESQKR